MSPSPRLSVLAGPDALAELRDGGLRASRVRVLVGASGGPKWLVLRGLDQFIFPWVLGGARLPVHAVASSIGSWRFACLCAEDPLAALERFEVAYVEEQKYSRRPTPQAVSAEGTRILKALLGERGVDPIVEHPLVRLHVVTARFRHLGGFEGRAQLGGLALAVLLNAVSRRALSASIERVVFDAAGDAGPFAPWKDLPTRHVALTKDNAAAALAASAAIPGVMAGVRDPPGAPRGTYRDGGVADYHFGVEVDPPDGLALYPHFYPHLVPGYFDKTLPYRRTRGLRRTVVVAPSPEFVASLPYGKIPDRKDFAAFEDGERRAAWRNAVAKSREIGEDFADLVESGRIAHVVKPLA